MKGSEKSSASPKGSDENDRSNHETGLNLQNPKKQTVKNFMSPTVSAVSKATFPRRKALAEKNESLGSNSSNTHLSKLPNLDSKPSPKTFPKASPKNSPNLDPKVTSKEPSSQKIRLSYNSRDETTSPRPQFLRYNPSRRKEILLSLDNKLSVSSIAPFDSKKAAVDEADTVYGDNSSFSSSSSQEDEEFDDESVSLLEQEDEEFDIESDEGAEKEVGWTLRGVLKYLLLLVVLVLTTSYISSMNSPTSVRAFQDLTLGYQTIQNHSHGIVEGVELGFKFFNGKKEQLGLWGLNQAIVEEGIKEEMADNVSLQPEDRTVESVVMVEEVMEDGKSEDACEEEFIVSGEASEQFTMDVKLQEKETVEKIGEVEKAEDVNENGETEDLIGDELVKTGKVSEQLVEDIKLREREESGEQIEDVRENGESKDVIEEELMKTVEVYDQIGDIELLRQETAGETEGTDLQEAAFHTVDSPEIEKVVSNEEGEETHNKASDSHMVQGKTGNAISMASAATVLERWGKYATLNQHMGREIHLKVMFGFFTCAAIVASLVLGSYIRRKGIASKHLTKPVVKEKLGFVLPAERDEDRVHVSSFANTMPLFSSAPADKDMKETYQSQAPSVELLGEFEVGGIGNSLMSSAIKGRMKDEVGSYSDFLEQGLGIKAYSAPAQDQQDFSEFPTVSSSERWTARKKLLRKEFGNNDMAGVEGEGRNNMVSTPLRRSARIRSRAVASP